MAQPVPTSAALDELEGLDEPPVADPAAIDRAYRLHRARRRARLERRRETQLARFRYWYVLAALLIVIAVVGVTVWREVERLFGL